MIFGPIFYSTIKKLKNWQQLLFATTLADRMLPNYEQYCLANHLKKSNISFLYDTIEHLWLYSEHRNDVKDWQEVKSYLLSLIIDIKENDEYQFGKYIANTSIQGLLIAIDSILEHTGNEATLISEVSINSVISLLEHDNAKTFTDEEIVENEYIQNELDFQMEVARTLQGHRSLSMFKKLRSLGLNEGYSNIGISRQ